MIPVQLSTRWSLRQLTEAIYRALTAAGVEDQAQTFDLATYHAHDAADTVLAAVLAAPSLKIDWLENRPV